MSTDTPLANRPGLQLGAFGAGVALALALTVGKLAVGLARAAVGLDPEGAAFLGWRRA